MKIPSGLKKEGEERNQNKELFSSSFINSII